MIQATEILNDLKCPFVINQNRYSILDRTIENNGLLNAVNQAKKGLIIFSPLAQGLLTNRYFNGIPNDSRVKTDGRFLSEKSISNDMLEKLKKLDNIAKNRGQSLAQMALAWVYSKSGVTSVLIGASRKEQILENLEMTKNTTFTTEELQAIDSIVL